MTATVVPVLRLRRATTGWSYKTKQAVQPGSLVIVSFRGHPTLGVVWDLEDNPKATAFIEEVLTATPLVRAPHRRLIEWMAEYGLCSLSTALYTWLPSALRDLPLTKPVRASLAAWDSEQPSVKTIALAKQHAILVPNHREQAETSLAKKYSQSFHSTFADATPAQEFISWLAIARGEQTVVTGRERGLFAPWVNLRHLTVIEPEDISFYTGQSPYLNLVEGSRVLAETTQAALAYRTNVPVAAARRIWPEASGLPQSAPIELTDLRASRIINESLIKQIKAVLEQKQHVILLYNAHDRLKETDDGERTVIPGIETLGKQVAVALGFEQLPSLITLGTRSILTDLPRPIGLTAILSLDPLLSVTNLADQMHGWGDIGRLLQSGAPLVVQTHKPEHPLPQSLLKGTFAEYCSAEITAAAKAGLPPFSEQVVCALPLEKISPITPAALASELQTIAPAPWQVSHPRPAYRRGKPLTIITLHAPQRTRTPVIVRNKLAALPRPWKVERGPWYAV